MRSNYSIKNSISSLICNIIMLTVNFISKTVFIKLLNVEYLGINGLFENIFTLLNFFELGIGSAIVYNLYKPISENDIPKMKSLVFFYKKAYRIISLIILMLGIMLLPFIEKIVGSVSVDTNIYIVYCLFLLNSLLTYSAAYKKSFIIANQRSFIINVIHVLYVVFMNGFQLVFLFIFKNFYIYLIIKIIFQLLENTAICLKANLDYPFLVDKTYNVLDKTTQKDIFSRVRALINHKFGAIIVFGTDNILISLFFGIVTVGKYVNYSFIFTTITSIFSGIIYSAAASVGNLLVENNTDKNMSVFKKINLLNFFISVFTSLSLFSLTQPFIQLWLGHDYLLEFSVLIVLVLNYYQVMMRNSYSVFKDSAGKWIEDKYVPIIESFLNVIISIILLKFFGLIGVFLGTIISSFTLWFYSYPKLVYIKILGGTYFGFIKNMIIHLLIFLSILCLSFLLSNIICIDSILLNFVYILFIVILLSIILFLFFIHYSDFRYFLLLFKNKRH